MSKRNEIIERDIAETKEELKKKDLKPEWREALEKKLKERQAQIDAKNLRHGS